MPLTRSSTKATRLVSPLIPQKRKSTTDESTDAEVPSGTEASSDTGALPSGNPHGDDEVTWSDVDQEDSPSTSMNDLFDQVIFLDNERQSPWTERGAPDKPRHWASQYVRTQQVIEPFSSKEEALISERSIPA